MENFGERTQQTATVTATATAIAKTYRWTEEDMQRAVIFAQENAALPKSTIAHQFNVNEVTLRRRVRHTQQPRDQAHEDQQLLSFGEENAIVDWCIKMADLGFPVHIPMLRAMAILILKSKNSLTAIIGEGCQVPQQTSNNQISLCTVLGEGTSIQISKCGGKEDVLWQTQGHDPSVQHSAREPVELRRE